MAWTATPAGKIALAETGSVASILHNYTLRFYTSGAVEMVSMPITAVGGGDGTVAVSPATTPVSLAGTNTADNAALCGSGGTALFTSNDVSTIAAHDFTFDSVSWAQSDNITVSPFSISLAALTIS